jgi:hypothetical protein
MNLPPLTLQPTKDDVDLGIKNDYDDAHSQMTTLSDGSACTEYINNNGGDVHATVPGQDEQVMVPAIDIEVDHQTAQTYDAHCRHMAFDDNSRIHLPILQSLMIISSFQNSVVGLHGLSCPIKFVPILI